MPHSTTDSNYTRSTYSPDLRDRSSAATSISSAASLLFPKPQRRPTIQPRKPRPRSTPGDWHTLLGTTPDHSNTSSQRSSLCASNSNADLIGHTSNNIQNDPPPRPMGGNRTSLSLNGGMDQKRRTLSYEEQYQYKDNAYGSARERVHRESPVVAELRTNVIIKDEFTLVTDMSYHLAARYTRPDSSIMINVDHSSCLALAGTFEPCYILTISVVPSQMQATTNKRNAALIQSFMADILSVPPERGIIKFVPVPEENYAFNGNTLFGEIERLEQQQLGNGGVKRAITDVRKSMPAFNVRKQSIPKLDTDFARKADQADGFDGRIEEMQTGAVPAPLRPRDSQPHIPDVFELAGPRKHEDRPSTSNGVPSNSSFAALNGLRLNGITKEDLEGPNTRTEFGRPKTIAGGPVWSSSTNLDTLPRRDSDDGAPAPIIKSEPRHHVQQSKPQDDIPAAAARKSPLPALKPASRSSTPVQKHSPAPVATDKTKPAYLENPPKSALANSHSRSKSKSQSPPEALPQDEGSAAANTAKRRSNVNATPGKVPPPPPVPEGKQAKVSKRKSFLSAFRSR